MTSDHEGGDTLTRATHLLRLHTDAGWTAISTDVLHRAGHAIRLSAPVRGRHETGDFSVADHVVVARVHEAVDAVPHAAAARITCDTNAHHELESLTVQVVVAYGSPVLGVADQIHTATARTLTDVLGGPARSNVAVHTQVSDVTDDPRDVC
ncbi:hypothetical protein [Cryptosporangium arvum]|uniref:hypothetical protein n=1 Tax=Cryptosporangium arvum TaxID=80871 RepID=UPI0012EE80B5|nr:hypothetical protein [Cryptosporangium arvum]